jgi:hypothetical protein
MPGTAVPVSEPYWQAVSRARDAERVAQARARALVRLANETGTGKATASPQRLYPAQSRSKPHPASSVRIASHCPNSRRSIRAARPRGPVSPGSFSAKSAAS